MKDVKSSEIHKKINSLDYEVIGILQLLAIHSVDLTIYNILFMFENNNESFQLCDNENNNLTDMSDGLSGELYSKEDWIESSVNLNRNIFLSTIDTNKNSIY